MKNLIYLIVLLAIAFLSQTILHAQSKTEIHGIVTDLQNKGLPFVNVFVLNSGEGTTTDDDGSFSFLTKQKGELTIQASMVGYKSSSKKIIVVPKIKTEVSLVLEENVVKLKESIVTASSYGSEKDKGVVVTRMDVLTTPGGAADIYQALKTLPGVTQVSESADLYVRGGDPIETITIIDQAVVYHTVTFESGYGGLFSNLNQSVVKSMYFTSGGFSAKYGNALSGVLDIETRNIPESQNFNLGISMANASFTAELPVVENKFGGYIDVRQSFTKPIFWLNGGIDRFTASPTSKNITGAIIYSYSETGRIKLFGVYADDNEGVTVDRAEYNGTFNGNSKNVFVNLQNSDLLSDKLLMKNSLSYNRYSNLWIFGILNLTKTDHVYDFRNDFEYTISSNSKLLSGIEFENRRVNYEGIIPYNDYNIRPDASSNSIDAILKGTRWGVYSEYQSLFPFGIDRLTFTSGVRFDKFPELNLQWIDPRMSLGYKLGNNSTLCFGWGIFHQIPDPRLFAPIDGNPDLGAMKATHYIASYEYALNENNSFRVEMYHKAYDNLPLDNSVTNYDNSGYGFANGVDVIIKGNFPFGITGWISYGYINTKRLWMDYNSYTSSDYDVTHNFTLVAKYNIAENWQIGLNGKFATGKPYTPVVSANYIQQQNIYKPVYAPTNSNRFPDYKRVDLRLTYFGKIFNQFSFVAYLEGLNILNLTNIFGYSYSTDYSQRKEIKSYFGYRMIVMGFSISI